MKYVFEPEVLQEVVRSHLDLPLEEMMTAITHDLAERYPGLIDTEPEWFFNNAGGAMGQLTMLYASFSEYLIFFGSPIGGGGHTGRYRFAEDYATVLDGEMWHHGEGDLQRQEYRPGETVHLPRGTARGYRILEGTWILEYARGSIPSMLPFGVADALFSTLDFTTLARTFRIYGRHIWRSARARPSA